MRQENGWRTLYIKLPETLVYKADFFCVGCPKLFQQVMAFFSRKVIFIKHLDDSFLLYTTKYLKHTHRHTHTHTHIYRHEDSYSIKSYELEKKLILSNTYLYSDL